MKYVSCINQKDYSIEVIDEHHVILDGQPLEVDFVSIANQPVYSLLIGGKSYEAYVYPGDDEFQVLLQGRSFSVKVEDEREKRLRAAGGSPVRESAEFHLRSPMPGMVIALPVVDGQKVVKGQVLVILESMKMQNELKSPKDGTLTRIKVKPGDNVEQRQTLLSVV
jgi:acetyl/propionyl-CoA carboxylase alpha subunit